MKIIDNVINDNYGNHVLPFLWMRGEEEAKIREYMEQIASTGIKEVCIESRPHDEFLKDKWWHDVDIIIEECEKHNMKLWILDDKHFPTGYAAGAIKHNYPDLQKLYLSMKQYDFVGPQKNAGILLNSAFQTRYTTGEGDSANVKAVVAAKKTDFETIDETTLVELTDFVKENVLYWDIPKGEWSIFVFLETVDGGEAATEGYLNPIVPEATDVLINTVYEAHYQHYGDKFGTVIQGFFSDEPRFGNIKGPDAKIGIEMPLPWCPNLEDVFAARLDLTREEILKKLPLLYRNDTPLAHSIRFEYMDLITDLYQKNFSERIGTWCREHQVKYIGHVIEDNNAHARLGYGPGHFFKSMAGQDMAGVDVVLHQLMPQQNKGYFKSMTNTGWDGEFFHYALARLGSSLGNLDPKKQGRTMSEVFGAYGWSEGTKLMKWLADHMLVRGVNHFVPHAFSMKAFPDPDCPPHFYGNGHNPQFPYFHLLIEYMNRVSYLLSGGHHAGEVGVLYHAEAEWSGKAMLVQKVTRVLTEHQIEYEIIDRHFLEKATVHSGWYEINTQRFSTLLVPYAERLPKSTIERLADLQQQGVQVIYLDAPPSETSENSGSISALKYIQREANTISVEDIMQTLVHVEHRMLSPETLPYVRYYEYQQDEGLVFMVFNENSFEAVAFDAQFPTQKRLSLYDPVTNQVRKIEMSDGYYQLNLSPSEAVILFEDSNDNELYLKEHAISNTLDLTQQKWNITFNGIGLSENTKAQLTSMDLPILGNGDTYSRFAGTITYETEIPESHYLTIENASEIVSVYVNDQYEGTRISTPYRFELSNATQVKSNKLRIEVINNLGRNQQDFLSQFITLEPLGIFGNVTVGKK